LTTTGESRFKLDNLVVKKLYVITVGERKPLQSTVSDCNILKFLCQLPNLKEIYIDNSFDNPISLTDLGPLKHLRNIAISHCGITEIQGLGNMVEMESILLSGGNITKIQGLENLTRLKLLDLGGNKIERIEGLDNLVALKMLSFGNNLIKKIKGLETLVDLKRLFLQSNCIQQIEGLDNQKSLEVLSLGNNNLFQGAKYVSRYELMKYIEHLANLKYFNEYRFPLREKIYLRHNPDCI